MKKTIWFLNQTSYLPEDGPHTRHFSLSKYLVKDGYRAIVFAGNVLHHTGGVIDVGKELYIEKECDGVLFLYIKTHKYSKNDIHRIINIISYYFNLFRVAKIVKKKYGIPNVIFASSLYPTALLAGVKFAKKYHSKCILETRDIFPEGMIKKGSKRISKLIYPLGHQFMKYVYYRADELIFTVSGGAKYISDMKWDTAHGGKIDLNHVYHVNNGVDYDEFVKNREKNLNKIDEYFKDDKFIVSYFGAIRYLNKISMFVDAAKILKERKRSDIFILIWGTGTKVQEIKSDIEKQGLDNIFLYDRVDKEYIPAIASKANLFLMSANLTCVDRYGASPNKLFDYFAAGKPIIVPAKLSDSLIEDNGAGVELSDATGEKIANEIIRFADMDAETYDRYCQNSFNMCKQFDYKELVKTVITIIEN